VLPASRLRFVLTTRTSGAEVTLGILALEGTKQVQPDALRPLRLVAADFAIGEEGRR